MGEIAEDMVEGRVCCLCGCFYHDPEKPDEIYEHGYPAACRSCWKDLSKSEQREYQRALMPTL